MRADRRPHPLGHCPPCDRDGYFENEHLWVIIMPEHQLPEGSFSSSVYPQSTVHGALSVVDVQLMFAKLH